MYLSYPPNVLLTVPWREAQILVEAETNIIAVEAVSREAQMEQVLFERNRDG